MHTAASEAPVVLVGNNSTHFATAYSKEENGLVERANQEVMRHLRAMLFDARVHDKWSYEQLPMVQRIMNTDPQQFDTIVESEVQPTLLVK